MNIDILLEMAFDAKEANNDYLKYRRKICLKYGLPPDADICISSLSSMEANRMGKLSRSRYERRYAIAQVCKLLDISKDRLFTTMSSINRWEAHNGRYDRCLHLEKNGISERLLQFLKATPEEELRFKSTGRMKPWCKKAKV